MKKLNLLVFFLLFLINATSPSRINAQLNCPEPTGLTVTATSQNSVTFNWSTSNFSGIFNVKYQLAGTVNMVSLNNVTSPLTITGLNCNSIYVLQLQQVCSNNGAVPILSPWSTITFSTQACQTVCEAPSGLTTTNVTQTSAVLNWNQNSPATGVFNLQYHSATSDTWISVNNVTMPFTLGNLTCSSGYAWRVQRVCNSLTASSPIVSAWSTSTFSTTACPTLCEPPLGVVATNITQTSAVLSGTPNSPNSLYNIQYHGPNTANWTSVNNVTLPYQLGNLACGVIYEWRVQRVCLNPTVFPSTLSPWTSTRFFTTTACQTICEAPLGLTTTNVTQTSAVLNWNQNSPATGVFNLQYHSATSDTWISVNNVTMPFTLGNLTCSSGYAWRVQRVCNSLTASSPVVSAWSTSTFSTTACPTLCEPPLGILATNINQSSAVFSGTPNSPNSLYNIQYHGPNTANWTTVNNVALPYQLGNLTCGVIYEWRVQRVCTNTAGTTPTLSAWTPTRFFTTTPCQTVCEAPSGLTTTNVTQTSAVLNWGIVSNAVSYLVYYKKANNTSALITVPTNTNSLIINGLIANTAYVFQVRAICTNETIASTLSPISTSFVFNTTNSFVIFPNPANSNFRISYYANNSSPIKIELRNNYGQLISNINNITTIGNNEFNINTDGISEGLYFLTLKTISDTIVTKVIVKH